MALRELALAVAGGLDRLVGGTGLRRGRRHPEDVRVGDAIDFWRVERVEPNRLLRLRAEMKVPGDAWLQFEATPAEHNQTLLVQTAYFTPKGLLGLLYWYTLYPLHRAIFSGLIAHVVLQAERRAEQHAQGPDIQPLCSLPYPRQTISGIVRYAQHESKDDQGTGQQEKQELL